MSKIYYIMMGLVLLISIIAVIDGSQISATDLSLVSSGSSGTVDIILDKVSTGLAGYQLDVNFSKEGVAEVKTVNFPAAFSMNSASNLPSPSVSIVAVDLLDQIAPEASNITLATLGIQGLSDGVTDLKITITELTDDSGNSISATTVGSKISVGSSQVSTTPTITPTPAPTASTVTPVTNQTTVPTTIPTTTAPITVPTTQPISEPANAPVMDQEVLKAAFMASPQVGTPPLSINFTDLSSGKPTGWKWNFGDGTYSTIQNPKNHVYGGIGRYTVTLEVSNENATSIERKDELVQVVGDYPTGPSGYIMVTSNPEGAKVYSNDRYLGTTPSTIIVPAGSMPLKFEKHGKFSKTIQITVRPDEIKLIPVVILKSLPN
jgi:PKD repeat protein